MSTLLIDQRTADRTGLGTTCVYRRGPGHSTAACSCGWLGRRRHLKAAAEQDAWSHCAHAGCGVSVPLVFPDRS